MKIIFPGIPLNVRRSFGLSQATLAADRNPVLRPLQKDSVTLRFGESQPVEYDDEFTQLLLLDQLIDALKKGDEAGMERAYAEGLRPNQTFAHGPKRELLTPIQYALEWAEIEEQPRLLDILLEHGEDPAPPFPDGSPTHITPAFYGMPKTLQRFLDAGVDPLEPNPLTGDTPLIAAANGAVTQSEYTNDPKDLEHYVETFEILLAHHVPTYAHNDDQKTAMDVLRDAEYPERVQHLLDLLEEPSTPWTN
jgi:hypothetical protein